MLLTANSLPKEKHMLDITETHSLTDFNRNTREHVDRLKASGKPEVLTVNGKAEIVVQDAASYQELLVKAEFADAVKAIRAGMKAHSQGGGKSMRKAIEEIAAEVGLKLE
jgi:hypothetical protein